MRTAAKLRFAAMAFSTANRLVAQLNSMQTSLSTSERAAQHERWMFPLLSANANRSVGVSAQVTWAPGSGGR
jgi:hypothetical protein